MYWVLPICILLCIFPKLQKILKIPTGPAFRRKVLGISDTVEVFDFDSGSIGKYLSIGLTHYITDINKYLKISKYRLQDWIDINKLNLDRLSTNPAAIKLLKANPNKINWNNLALNPAAIGLITTR